MALIERFERKLLLFAVFLLTVFAALHTFEWMEYYLPEFPGQSTEDFVAGTATKPFVYRLLVPKTTAAIDAMLPESTKASLGAFTKEQWSAFVAFAEIEAKSETVAQNETHFRLRLISGAIMFLYLIGYGVALYKLGAFLFPESGSARHVAPLLGYIMLPVGIWQCSYMYDPATLCLAAWSFYLMVRQRWLAYLTVFALACINKETSIYIILAYVVCLYDRMDRKQFMSVLFVQGCIYLLVTITTHMSFAGNEGMMVEHHWKDYFQFWTLTVPPQQIMAEFAGLLLLLYHWQDKPLMLRRTMWVVASAVILWLYGGRAEELRGLYDVYPYIALMLTHTLAVATGIDKTTFFARQQTNNKF